MSHYKAYPKYKDSGVEWIGEVPEGWEVKRLRHISAFKNSSVDKKTYEGQAVVGLCNYTDVYYNEFITKDLPFMQATASPTEIEQFSLQKGDVIITKDSEDPSDIGIPALVADDVPGVICGYHLTQIRAGDLNTARLIHRTMQSHVTQAYFFVEAPGITRYGLGQDTIGNVSVCLPPPDDRATVAVWIDRETARVDAIIAKKTRFIELLKEKRSALITHAVTQGINPNVKMKDSGVEWIGEVPEHWDRRKIAHAFACIGSGTTPPSDQDRWYSDGEIPWITTGELRETVITETSKCVTTKALEEFSTLRLYPAGSLAIAMYGATIGRLGILGVPATTNQACCVLSGEISLSIRFAYFWLLAFKQQIIDLYAAGGGQPNINQEVIAYLRVPAPNLVEQATIAAFLDRETARIDLLTQKTQHSIDLLKERRAALITAAVTGQIDLREET